LMLNSDSKSLLFAPMPFPYFCGSVDLKYLSVSEYEMYPPKQEIWIQTLESTKDGAMYWSHTTLRMKIARKWSIYFWRIGIFTMILSMCALSVFTLDKDDDRDDRYGMLLTLLLAAVAFQYIINSELPKLPYLTLMDKYVLFSFAYLFLGIVFVTIGAWFEVSDATDIAFLWVLVAVFVVFHIWFIATAYFARKYELKKLDFDRWDYERNGYNDMAEDDKKKSGYFLLHNKDMAMDDVSKQHLLQRSWWTDEDDWTLNGNNKAL